MPDAIRVYIGTEPKTEIARKVLEFSVRKNTKADVEFVPMLGPEWEYDTAGFKQGTGFSLRRWMIPEKAGWTGRAIYLDADQLVFGDIQELFDYPDRDKPATACPAWMTFQPSKFSRKPHPHSSVMVIDCEEAKRHQFFHIDSVVTYLKSHTDKKSYASLMFPDWCNPRMLPTVWNSLNVYQKGQTKLLHYTKEPEQPWYVPAHPLAKHWRAALQEAVRAGVVTSDEIRAAVSQFGVKQDWRSTNGLHPDYLRVLQTK